MNLLAELDLLSPARKGPECGVAVWLSTLPDDVQAEVRAVLLSRHNSSIVRTFLATKLANVPVAAVTIQRHRRKVRDGGEGCQCRS